MARNRKVYGDAVARRRELNREDDFGAGSGGGVGRGGPAGRVRPLTKAVHLARSRIAGTGVFASRRFYAGDWIMSLMEGVSGAVSYRETTGNAGREESNYVQIGFDLYIYPFPPALYLNHACDPNTGVRDGTEVVALKGVEAGTELTFDYSTSMAEDAWEMDCACGAAGCRRRIRDFKYLPRELQLYYIERGVVGDFCVEDAREMWRRLSA